MMKYTQIKNLLACLFLFLSFAVQANTITGKVISKVDNEPIVGAMVFLDGTDYAVYTNASGRFRLLNVSNGEYEVKVAYDEYQNKIASIVVDNADIDLGTIYVEPSEVVAGGNDIAVLNLNLVDDADGDSQISSVLTASRDPFQQAAAYNLSAGRYRIRGYQSKETEINLNGFPVNDTEDGGYYWGTWGGLNDVFRNQENTTNMDAVPYAFGGMGGATQIDLRASVQRPQLKIVNDFGNRSYTFRHMITYSTGEMENGWSFSFSGSKRWGKRGYIKGTFYDAYSYFASIEKRINSNHSLNFVALGAPSYRGRSSASTQEMYDLVGTNYYNPNWGYSNGKVVNSRTYNFHQPIVMLRHDWNIGANTTLTTNVAYKTGYNGSSRLDWYGAPDPRPDYYKNLPSYANDSTAVANLISENVNLQQLDFDKMWRTNLAQNITIDNANGTGQSITGKRSAYIIEEQRFDDNKFSINTNLTTNLTDKIILNAGVNYLNEKVDNYRLIKDLMGGDFYVDIDKFQERDNPGNESVKQNDLNRPNRILKEGDRWGYDFSIISNKINSWAQVQAKLNQLDVFASLNATFTEFHRDSYVKNGAIPDNSFGKSKYEKFFTYGVKAGATYKLDGRNYFYGIGSYRTRAPFSRQAFVSPRSSHEILDGLKVEEIFGGELGYIFRYPSVKGKIAAYYTKFENQLETRNLFYDNINQFGTYILRDVDKRHQGVEFGVEAKATQTVTLSFAGAVGRQQYANNPMRSFGVAGQGIVGTTDKVYIKNFYLQGPQSAVALGLDYRSPKFWFARLSLNYFNGMYLSPYADRRSDAAVATIQRPSQDALFYQVIKQTKLDDQFTMDLFAGKSFKIEDSNLFVYLSVGNLLNNKKFITGGYEQSRFNNSRPANSLRIFQPKLYYSYGINFSLGVSYRL